MYFTYPTELAVEEVEEVDEAEEVLPPAVEEEEDEAELIILMACSAFCVNVSSFGATLKPAL